MMVDLSDLKPQPVIFVHGYSFDPSKADNDPCVIVYRDWKLYLMDRRTVEFTYYSAGGGWRALLKAWAAGYRNTYRWAYSRLAVDAVDRLVETSKREGPCNVVCHSLGSRVVLEAAIRGAEFDRVVILGGAEMVPQARIAARRSPNVQYLNVMSTTDDVLDLMAEHFTPGTARAAIGHDGVVGLPNWRNAVLDDNEVQAWAWDTHEWTLNGDLQGFGDHHVYYRWAGNWSLYKAFLDGDDLDDMPDKAREPHNNFFD